MDEPEDASYTTIPALLDDLAERLGDREALVDRDVRLTFRELRAQVHQAARAVIAVGVQPGDRVAVWAPNHDRWVLAALGLLAAGAVLVPVNTRFRGAEAGYVLRRSGARLLLVDDGFLGNAYVDMLRDGKQGRPGEPVPGLPDLTTVVSFGVVRDATVTSWEDFLATGDRVAPEEVGKRVARLSPDDVSDILFTSGTTGAPKGAMLTHRQNLLVDRAWSDLVGLREGDRYLIVNPFFHSFGYRAGLLACLIRGATIIPQAVFNVDHTLHLVDREKVTVLPGPPTLYTSILDHPARDGHDLRSVRLAVTGATVVPVALIERMRRELSFQRVVTAYGLTESCGTATVSPPEADAETVATTVGLPLPGTELRIVDAGGRPQPVGVAGEVLVRGYNVMRGYFADPAATAAAVDADGWLHTGDVGVLDERGYLRITDRLKDMFVVGGFNAYPAEIEQVLAAHPAVSEAAVIGVPDQRLGEVGRAFVIPRPGVAVDEADLIGFCRERLANFKVPRSVVLVEELPRNAGGKVLKYRLRGEAG